MSAADMLQHMVRNANELSSPITGLMTTKRPVAAFVTMKDQVLLYPVSFSPFFMLSILMPYLAHPLLRIKSTLQSDLQLQCLAAKTFKVDVGSSVAKIFTMDFAT